MRKTVDYVRRNFHYIRPLEWQAAAKALYRRFSRSGIFISEDEMPLCSLFPEQMLSKVVARFNPKSVLDVGCGTGRALEFFLSKGIDAVGIEGSAIARVKSLHPDRIIPCDLRKPVDLGRTFDLVWCFEVAEHIHSRFTMCSFKPWLGTHRWLLCLRLLLVREAKVISICNRRPIGSQKLRTLDLSSIPKLQPSSQTHGNSIPTTLWCLFGNDLTIVRVR